LNYRRLKFTAIILPRSLFFFN